MTNPAIRADRARWDEMDWGSLRYALSPDGGHLTSLTCAEDADGTEFLLTEALLRASDCEGFGRVTADGPIAQKLTVAEQDKGLRLTVTVTNPGEKPIRLKQVQLPLPMDQWFRNGEQAIYEKNVLRHSCLMGRHAYVTWSRLCGQQPTLLLLCEADTPVTHFTLSESVEEYMAGYYEGTYALSLLQKPTKLMPGEQLRFHFRLAFLTAAEQLPNALAALGGLGVEVCPGMVIPSDWTAKAKLHHEGARPQLIPSEGDTAVFDAEATLTVRFSACGERPVRLVWPDGGETTLTWFVTEPLNTLYREHAAFITTHQQETDPEDPCFGGFLPWELYARRRINSRYDPYDDWMGGGSDEIGLVPALFLAAKVLQWPTDAEVDALCRYEQDFVEKRLTEQPGWRVHRMVPWFKMFEPWAGHGADDVWRAFNYVHVINFYGMMAEMADGGVGDALRSADYYLERAAAYTESMFRWWMFPDGVGATHYCNMGETYIAQALTHQLRRHGLTDAADRIDRLLDDKCGILAQRKYPFGSEMAYDTTAFEAAYAYARRGGNDALADRACAASLSNRGWQPVWHKYGVDIRMHGDSLWNNSYMTSLGMWPLVSELIEGRDHSDALALKVWGANLASLALYNSGGWWHPAPEDRGSCIWVYNESADQYHDRSGTTMRISGEGSYGLYAALRGSVCIRLSRPACGETCLGCRTAAMDGRTWLCPTDGVGRNCVDLAEDWAVSLSSGEIVAVCRVGERLLVKARRTYPQVQHIELYLRIGQVSRRIRATLSDAETLLDIGLDAKDECRKVQT